jgi:hypothetical protein
MSSALAVNSPAMVSGLLGCPAARSRCMSRAAAPAACGAEADVPTIATPGQTAVDAGATTSGFRRPSSVGPWEE